LLRHQCFTWKRRAVTRCLRNGRRDRGRNGGRLFGRNGGRASPALPVVPAGFFSAAVTLVLSPPGLAFSTRLVPWTGLLVGERRNVVSGRSVGIGRLSHVIPSGTFTLSAACGGG